MPSHFGVSFQSLIRPSSFASTPSHHANPQEDTPISGAPNSSSPLTKQNSPLMARNSCYLRPNSTAVQQPGRVKCNRWSESGSWNWMHRQWRKWDLISQFLIISRLAQPKLQKTWANLSMKTPFS